MAEISVQIDILWESIMIWKRENYLINVITFSFSLFEIKCAGFH